MSDDVNHPAHYTMYKHEVIELTSKLDFCLGNAVKYILRAPYKGCAVKDYQKAMWYVKYIAENGCRGIDPEVCEFSKVYKNNLVTKLLDWVASGYCGSSSAEILSDLKDLVICEQEKQISRLENQQSTSKGYWHSNQTEEPTPLFLSPMCRVER